MDEIIQENDLMICTKCGGHSFEEVAFLIYKTRLNNPTIKKDSYLPMKTYRCADCKTVPDSLDFTKQKIKEEIKVISKV